MNPSLDRLEKEFRTLASRLLEVEGKNTEEERLVQSVVDEFVMANELFLEASSRNCLTNFGGNSSTRAGGASAPRPSATDSCHAVPSNPLA